MSDKRQLPKEGKVFPLNPAQKSAVHAPAAPLLIVAGAGTGKTRTLTNRLTHLVESGIPPGKVCAITFTNKAAKEMISRLPAFRGRGVNNPFIGTFHSLGARILRKECRALGRGINFAIFDDHDSFDLIKKILKGPLTLEGREVRLGKKDTPAFFGRMISEMKNIDPTLSGLKETLERKALILSVFEKYEGALQRNNAFDFDDLIQKPVTLFINEPSVLKKYQDSFDAVLVDEYQDINPMQYRLVKLLAGGHRNLSVVGDDEQVIYSWRYANIRTFLDFEKEWSGAKIYFLEENYRSTGNIIQAASAVVGNNRFRTPKKLWTQNPDGESISLFEGWGENDEAHWIAAEIGKLNERAETAILYRTNAQSRALEQALIRHDIPYQIFGGLKFYERREVKDAVAALRWASNGQDEVARERLEKNFSKKKFATFSKKIGAETQAGGDIAPPAIVKIFLESFDYFDYLEGNFLNADEREENIAELINFASEFKNLPDLLEKISLLQAVDDESVGKGDAREGKSPAKPVSEKVNLMTIHLAKGLEFKNVFIAGVSEGLLPHIRSIESEESLEEERRLMYVAMTRAKEKLHVSFYGMPSRFIGEIPEQCVSLIQADGAEERVIDLER